MRSASSSTRRARPLLGTFVVIATGEAASPGLDAVLDAAFDAVATVHSLMSFHEPSSDVSRLNREAGRGAVVVHDWTFEVLQAALDLDGRSGGVFDIAIAPALQRLGRLPVHAGQPQPDAGTGKAGGFLLLDGNRVRFSGPEVSVDLGGIAKGYAVDRALAQLRRAGLASAHVNAGGDQAVFGGEPSEVHIRDPRQPGRLMTSIALYNGAVASSGGSFDPVTSAHPGDSAVIDPTTGQSGNAIAGASVCAPTCMIADALTKVVMLMGQKSTGLIEDYRASALLVSANGEICATSNWPRGGTRAI